MQKRKIDEMITHFNRKVADMDINMEYKMELLGMITAIGIACEKELSIEPGRKKGVYLKLREGQTCWVGINEDGDHLPLHTERCSVCDKPIAIVMWRNYCPNCGARMEGEA